MEILIPDISLIEKLVRTAVSYSVLLLAFRLAGNRQLGLLVISNPMPNALIADRASSVSSRAHRVIRRRPA
jgi:uncharacterized membrane protein YcaP (DUF421 family)